MGTPKSSKRRTSGTRRRRKYRPAQQHAARIRENEPKRLQQPQFNSFEGFPPPGSATLDASASTALYNALRRYGIEGEEAFLALAYRLLDARRITPELSFFPTERAVAALNVVSHDKQVISLLDGVVASDPHGHLLPAWYQFFFGRRFREGSGKFFTPRTVAAAMTRLLPIKPDAIIMDPACGGGTFLLEASRRWQSEPCKLFGNDVDRMLVGLSELVLALSAPANHSFRLFCCNLYEENSEFSALRGKVDAILANPPFSLPIEHTSRRSDLFEMGYQNSDAVFLDVCLDLLAPGGILVCLLPHSLVANNDFARLRRKVERDWNLCGVVTLPEGVFYLTGNTSTRADIVQLQKRAALIDSERNVFFANAPSVGFPLNSRSTYFGENALEEIVSGSQMSTCVDGINGK
jgi:SAM-dependent methyltransferase